MSDGPSHWPLRLLRLFCPPHLYEEIEGDLVQKFHRDAKVYGELKAKRRFVWNVIWFFRLGIILRNKFSPIIKTIMIGNYFKVASRNILKRKLYSFINAFGLSIGIAFCLLIYLFIQDENSFDQFHVNKHEIYRIDNRIFEFMEFKNGSKDPFGERETQHGKLGEVMVDELAEVNAMTRYFGPVGGQLRYNEKVFSYGFRCVDSNFFKMFSFKLLAGNPDKIFKDKSEIVLTREVAEKYFGDEDPIGKQMILDLGEESPVTVTGVIEDPPANSSLPFKILIPLEKLSWYKSTWDNHSFPTFVQLLPGTDLISFQKNLNTLYKKYTGDGDPAFREREQIPEEFVMEELHATNLSDIHLDTKIKWERSSDPKYSIILGGIAILILIIACINYISLALTSSSTRKTEVGIRKVSGAIKSQLVIQFGLESMLLTFISMIIGLLLVILFLPFFNSFTNKGIILSTENWLQFSGITLLITCIVGVIAGSYPALYLSGLKPIQILTGRFTAKTNTWFIKPLMVIQFALSTFLIMSSVVMYNQMKYITTKDLGYDQHHVLFIYAQPGWADKSAEFVENFRSATVGDAAVKSVAGTSIAFTYGTMTMGYKHKGESKMASAYIVDPSYLSTLGIELLEGRNFDINNPADLTDAVIVNEALVKDLKWTEPLSEHLNWKLGTVGAGSKVIGVVRDHHFLSLERSIEPMFLTMDKSFGAYQVIIAKISSENIPETIHRLERVYKSLAPDEPFEYTFLDENIQLQYQSYTRWMNIMGLATAFAILISCLGLFGLAGMNAVNRTKEIGIRKVLGASLANIFILLNKQFVWLSVIAFALAAYPAWFAMNLWLDSFQFKIEISWILFVISMAASLLMALITVSYHTVKAGHVNPAETLKYE